MFLIYQFIILTVLSFEFIKQTVKLDHSQDPSQSLR